MQQIYIVTKILSRFFINFVGRFKGSLFTDILLLDFF